MITMIVRMKYGQNLADFLLYRLPTARVNGSGAADYTVDNVPLLNQGYCGVGGAYEYDQRGPYL